MNTVTVICDPISSRASVQFGLVVMVIQSLRNSQKVSVISPYIASDKIEMLRKTGNVSVTSLSDRKPFLRAIFRLLEMNEAMLWSVSWLLEVLFRSNSSLIKVDTKKNEHAVVVNLAYTLPISSRLYWNQAAPPLKTLKMMSSNPLAPILELFFGRIIEFLDRSLRARHRELSARIANNSEYLRELYRGQEFFSDDILHLPKKFTEFNAHTENPTRDYVLAYIGKEVEADTLIELANLGLKIVVFGAKIPFGTPLKRIKEIMDFRGYVSDEELSGLYYNALFTVFPFTEEPFGWVPLESMYYGTAVLSYNKQGPSETIIDGKTGWLSNNREELMDKAIQLWSSKSTNILPSACKERAMHFSFEETGRQLNSILYGDSEGTVG